MGSVANPESFSAVFFEHIRYHFGLFVILLQQLNVVFQREDASGRDNSGLSHGPAQSLPHANAFRYELLVADEDGSHRGS